MGACTSKQNVLNCEAPEVKPENAAANSVGLVIKKDVAKNDETLIAEDGDSDKNPSLDNLLNNEEDTGSIEDKEETSVKASKVASEEDKLELEDEKVVDDGPKTDASTCVEENKTDEVKSKIQVEKNVEEVVKPLVESENKIDDQKKLPEVAPTEKTVEEVKPAITEDKNIEVQSTAPEDPNFEAEKKKTEDKPASSKKGKFWWDK
ncbi:chromo domain-containing protein cec-1 [Capsicum chacoense]